MLYKLFIGSEGIVTYFFIIATVSCTYSEEMEKKKRYLTLFPVFMFLSFQHIFSEAQDQLQDKASAAILDHLFYCPCFLSYVPNGLHKITQKSEALMH